MDRSNTSPVSPSRVLVRAAAWRKYLSEIEAETTEDFECWLAADDRHRDAWLQVQAPWDLIDTQMNSPEMLVLRRAAWGHARATSHRRSRRAARYEHRVRYAWAAGLAMLVIGGFLAWAMVWPDTYQTALGERRTITLDDGSTLTLDSSTQVRVSYSRKSRELTLLGGQARFEVARDVERPFSVEASSQKVIATGTVFNVDKLGSRLRVTLLEGRVTVLDQDTHTSLDLKPGEQLEAVPNAAPYVSAANLDVTMAWLKRQLIFEDEPLSAVAERVSRYSAVKVEVADAKAGALRVSGVFSAGDMDQFVSTMAEYLPVVAEQGNDNRIRLKSR